MVTSQSAKSEASEDFASDLTEEDLQMERFDLVDDLRNWIVDPKANKTSEANKTPVIGDLEGIIKLEARFQKQGNEEQDTALRLAASVIKWTTRETFDQIPSSTSALEVKRYIDVLLYFKKRKWIDENRLKKLSIQNPVQFALAMFWTGRDVQGSNQKAARIERLKWKNLKDTAGVEDGTQKEDEAPDTTELKNFGRYLLLHDFLAQAIGAEMLSDMTYPVHVFRDALEQGREKRDPVRIAASTAAFGYLYHAKEQIHRIAFEGQTSPDQYGGILLKDFIKSDLEGEYDFNLPRFDIWMDAFKKLADKEDLPRFPLP